MMKCEWCEQEIDSERYFMTGLSHEYICINCSDEVDENGYDINEI